MKIIILIIIFQLWASDSFYFFPDHYSTVEIEKQVYQINHDYLLSYSNGENSKEVVSAAASLVNLFNNDHFNFSDINEIRTHCRNIITENKKQNKDHITELVRRSLIICESAEKNSAYFRNSKQSSEPPFWKSFAMLYILSTVGALVQHPKTAAELITITTTLVDQINTPETKKEVANQYDVYKSTGQLSPLLKTLLDLGVNIDDLLSIDE